MEQVFDNFVYFAQQAEKCTFSLRGSLPTVGDSIDLPMLERKSEWFFTLPGSFSWSALEVAADKLLSLTLTISDAVFHCAKRVLRRAVAGVRHFVRSNQGGMRRVAPMVPMALRL